MIKENKQKKTQTEQKAKKDDEDKEKKQGQTSNEKPKKQKLTFNEKKEFDLLNEEIPVLEKEQKSLEEKMSSSDFAQIQKATERYQEISKLLDEKYERWEILAEKSN